MSVRAPGSESRLNPKQWRDQVVNPGPVSGRESVRRLLTPRTLPSTCKGLGAHLNYRRDTSVTSKEGGVNAGHHRAQAWWVRGELKGVIATNVEAGMLSTRRCIERRRNGPQGLPWDEAGGTPHRCELMELRRSASVWASWLRDGTLRCSPAENRIR